MFVLFVLSTLGTCACEVGWEGFACDECIPMPGCREGYCEEAFGCTCNDETKWTGALCDCREIIETNLSPSVM